MVDSPSSADLLDPGNLGRFVLPPDLHGPGSNVIQQPLEETPKSQTAFQGPGDDGENVKGGGSDGKGDGGVQTVAPVDADADAAGYSSRPDDGDD